MPAPDSAMPPGAAERDAAKRERLAADEPVLSDEHVRFVTRQVSAEQRAAVIAALTQLRAEETQRVRRVERREHQPWARSQRVPTRITDLLPEGG